MSKETLLIDYSESRPKLGAVKHSGYIGAVRYLSFTASKNLTRAEAKQLHDAGLAIALVWETTATRATGGEAAGKEDAAAAERQATALGYPAGCVIFYAVDEGVSAAAVRPYFVGIKAAAKHHLAGVYGSIHVVDGILADGLVSHGWQAAAWSAGAVSKRADLYQRVGHNAPAVPGGGYDENVVLRPFPMWGPKGVVTVSPPGKKPKPIGTDLSLVVRPMASGLAWHLNRRKNRLSAKGRQRLAPVSAGITRSENIK